MAALDSSTGLEWVSLGETTGLAYNNIDNILQNSFAGWRLATESEVLELMQNTIGDVSYTNGSAYLSGDKTDQVVNFISMMGYSYSNTMSIGLVYSDVNSHLSIAGVTKSGAMYAYDTSVNYNHRSSGWAEAGIYLVSDGGTTLSSINDPSINIVGGTSAPESSVPLPASAGLLGLGLLGFVRRKAK